MQLKRVVTVLSAIAFATGAGLACANTLLIYNESCRNEVEAFQRASNVEDAGDSRHALLLCLADDAYIYQTQTPSGYAEWSGTKHFQIFGQHREVKVGDTALSELRLQTPRQPERAPMGGAVLSDRTRSCSCTRPIVTRGPGAQTSPRKMEPRDVYFTMNLGDVLARGPDGIEDLKGLLDQVFNSGAVPFAPDQQAANIIARFGDVRTQVWQNQYDPGNTARTAIGGQTGYPWSAHPHDDWASKLTVQAAGGVSSTCGCPEHRIPLKRFGGDSVPSSWREAGEFYFTTNDIGALIENMQRSGLSDGVNRVQRGQ